MKFRHRCGPVKIARRRLRQWYDKHLGKTLQNAEKEHLDEILPDMFGYYLIQMGYPYSASLLESSRISHRIVIDIDQIEDKTVSLCATASQLPVATDSIDVLLLPHTLELEEDPHQVLREADRILIPEGHIIIVGFNPFGFWGVWRKILSRLGEPPWCGRFYSVSRLKDWLSLLGFETIEVRKFFHRPPCRNEILLRRLGFIEKMGRVLWPWFSGVYILVAKKQVFTLTPIKNRKLNGAKLFPKRIVEPSSRVMRNDSKS